MTSSDVLTSISIQNILTEAERCFKKTLQTRYPQRHALIYRTPRVRHSGPEGYGASDPRGAIWTAISILSHQEEEMICIALKLNRLEKGDGFGEKMLYLCSGKQKKNTIESIRQPLLQSYSLIVFMPMRSQV